MQRVVRDDATEGARRTGAAQAPVVAVDGPGGSGKGTISRLLARRLRWHFLDSGALYRVVALAAGRAGASLDDVHAVARIAQTLDVRFLEADAGGSVRVLLAGEDVSEELRSEECGARASRVATLPAVRAALLGRQRELRRAPGLVADGRDMGSVVFPDAEAKIFLTASLEERTQRRYKQLIEKGIDVSLPELSGAIEARDRRDRERPAAPLRPAEDAVVIDTTGQTIEAVLDRVVAVVRARGLCSR